MISRAPCQPRPSQDCVFGACHPIASTPWGWRGSQTCSTLAGAGASLHMGRGWKREHLARERALDGLGLLHLATEVPDSQGSGGQFSCGLPFEASILKPPF